jgi:8-oxo-dGTP pyrophosphatase MutT (NUDIX family)
MSALPEPTDNNAYRFPVSIKGVIIRNAQVILLKNERAEWELPGGKLDPGESPEVCVVREIAEELCLDVEVRGILDSWVYEITPEVRVLIVTYGCQERTHRAPVLSHEHKQLGWFPVHEVAGLPMPYGYKQSIAHWSRLLSL